MVPWPFPTSATIETRLVSLTARAVVLRLVPARVHADRPLEVDLAAVRFGTIAGAVTVSSWISAHARLVISVERAGQPQGHNSLPMTARPSGDSWIARVLVHPAYWADAASVSVVSLSLAGRPLPCDCLPATLRVGYNHAPAPAGAVYAAAKAGDVAALLAALEAGGSTEEANGVSDDL